MNVSTILTPLDLSPLSGPQFEAALGLAGLLHAKRLHALHVQPEPPPWLYQFPLGTPAVPRYLADEQREQARARLNDYVAPASSKIEVTREVRAGAPVEEIVEAAKSVKADMMVIGMRRRLGFDRAILGSVAHTLIRAAPCPTLVVNEGHRFRYPRKMVAAVDLSPVSTLVLDNAMLFAQASADALERGGEALESSGSGLDRGGPSVEVVSCSDLCWITPTWADAPPVVLDERERAELMESQGAAIDALIKPVKRPAVRVNRRIMPEYPPWKMIVDRAEILDADLIVIGSSGHNAWQRFFLGSTALKVLTHAPCPVLVVPPPVRVQAAQKVPASSLREPNPVAS